MNSMRRLMAAGVIGVVVSSGGQARALSLLVSPDIQPTGGDTSECRIVNEGSVAISVDIELRSSVGNSLVSGNLVVQPGRSQGIPLSGASGPLHCVFGGTFAK